MASLFMKDLPIALAMVTVITPTASVSAQEAGWVPVYDHYYYNDSNFSSEIGHNRDTCNAYGVGQTAVEGSWSSYVRNEIYAYCDPYGEIHPY